MASVGLSAGRELKIRQFNELKGYVAIMKAFFRQMEAYLTWQMERSDYSAAVSQAPHTFPSRGSRDSLRLQPTHGGSRLCSNMFPRRSGSSPKPARSLATKPSRPSLPLFTR